MAANVRFLLIDLPLLLAWSALTLAIFAVIALQLLFLTRSIGADVSRAIPLPSRIRTFKRALPVRSRWAGPESILTLWQNLDQTI